MLQVSLPVSAASSCYRCTAALLPLTTRNTPDISSILATLKKIKESMGHFTMFCMTLGGRSIMNACPYRMLRHRVLRITLHTRQTRKWAASTLVSFNGFL